MNIEAAQILDSNQEPAPTLGGVNKDVIPAQPATPKEEPVSHKLSVLMERESRALSRERTAKSEIEKLQAFLKEKEEFESLKRDPSKVNDLLGKLGWDYDKLTQSRLQDGEVPPTVMINQLNDKISALEEKLKLKEESQLEADKRKTNDNEQRAVGEFKSEITEYLKSNSARYELIDFEGAHDLVFDIIDEHYNRTIDPTSGIGKVMSISEASDKVEKHLEDKYQKAREKNKVKAFWSNMPKGLQSQLEKQKTSQTQPGRTITNNLSPSVQQRQPRQSEDKRVDSIIQQHLAKMRTQYA